MISLLLLTILPLRAEVPLGTFPECGEIDRPDLCPSDLGDEWTHISYIPIDSRETIRPAELELGSGMWADRAYRLTTGRFDVLLAVADSGIDWSSVHLLNKWYLNADELPRPQDADGVEAADYDYNGDGVFNMEDWADDPRVDPTLGRDRADSVRDPSDLIALFSDGVDDDGNGYTDDISGWDFFGRDNDAFHELTTGYGTHGAGVAKEMAAEGGDGGTLGVCPNCAVLPVRAGDTFVTDGNRAAEAIAFAVDSGAAGVTLAMGTISGPEQVRAAAKYAFEQGTTLVGAAGDENAYHHNQPAMLDNIMYVHSITSNTASDDDGVYSYSNTWNCNNYGARLDIVAPSGACATGAVANITGVVGLIHSAAADAGVALHAGEVRQLLNHTADDISLTADEVALSKAYPSHPGWDAFFGYGRVNAAHAVEAVAAGEIPPWTSMDSPAWFQTLDPADSPTVDIIGTLSAERSDSYTYDVEYGLGHDPLEWIPVDSGSGSGRTDGVLATVDISEIPWTPTSAPDVHEGVLERVDRVFESAVTVRVNITDAEGLVGSERRTFFVDADPDRLPGFPFDMEASGESSPVLSDLDGDGVYEIIVGTGGGRVLALNGAGEMMPGWPVQTDVLEHLHDDAQSYASGALPAAGESLINAPAVADIDGDGVPEVIVASFEGGLYAWHADGSVVDGFPRRAIGREPEEFDYLHTYDQGFAGAPVIYDLDGDGVVEIIAVGMDSRLYVVSPDGSDWGPYPIEVCHPTMCGIEGYRIIDSPTVGDVDGDGDGDIGFGSNEPAAGGSQSVSYLFDGVSGTPLDGWPRTDMGLVSEAVLLPFMGEGHPASMGFADLDGDGDLEISNPVMFGISDVLNHDGTTYMTVPYFGQDYGEKTGVDIDLVPAFVQFATNPAFGDLDGDGHPDLVLGGAGTLALVSLAMSVHVDFQHPVGAWSGVPNEDGDGAFLPAWPQQIEDMQFLMAPAIADLSGDGRPEVVYGSAGYIVHAWDADGVEPEGWPKFTGNWLLGSPAIGDIDGDGYLDVVVTSREGYLFAWSTAGPADVPPQWASVYHDPMNTGNHAVELPAQAGPVSTQAQVQGCCKNRSTGSAALLAFLPLGLAFRRRRSGPE